MSKDIWHSALEIPLFDDAVVFIDDLNNWHTGYTQRDNDGITDHDSGEIYTEENVLRWAYIKDLLALETDLERTRKALDVALCSLQDIAESNGDFITGDSTPLDEHEYADMMLKEIKRQMKIKTAIEQKDVK